MNFFGHAVIANAVDDEPCFVLGAMIPDYESMTRTKLIRGAPSVRRGIALHHVTDDAFHRAPIFVAFCTQAFEALTARGVRRGTARAVAHVGIEMLLDGHLAHDRAATRGFVDALHSASDGAELHWSDGGRGFDRLAARLIDWGQPADYASVPFVVHRLHDALRERPRLAIVDHDTAAVTSVLSETQPRIAENAEALIDAALRAARSFDQLQALDDDTDR